MPSHPFRPAIEARDPEAVAATMTEDVLLHSPVFFKPVEGRESVIGALLIVDQVLSDLVYVDELAGESSVALKFDARVGDLELQGIDHLDLDSDGLVQRLTVFMRPYKAVTAFRQEMIDKVQAATT